MRSSHRTKIDRLAILLAVFSSLAMASFGHAQSPNDAGTLVDQVLEALGGREAWDAIEALETTGTYSAFSAELPFRLLRQRPDLYRFEHAIGGAPVTVGYDGETVWWESLLPFVPVPWASPPPLPYQRGFQADAEFLYPFLDPARRGHLEYGGATEFEGMSVYELKVPLENGVVETWYFDTRTLLPSARLSVAGFKDFEAENRVFFSDFRSVGGIQIPFHAEHEVDNLVGFLQVEAATVNPVVEPESFRMPRPEILRRLEDLVGEWSVRVEVKPLPHLPWIPSEGSSEISRLADGQSLEETLSFVSLGLARTIERFYTHDRFEQRFEMAQIDSLTGHIDLFVGTLGDDGTIAAENTGTGTAWAPRGPAMPERFVLEPTAEGGYRMEWSRSPDGGNQWLPYARFLYSRDD